MNMVVIKAPIAADKKVRKKQIALAKGIYFRGNQIAVNLVTRLWIISPPIPVIQVPMTNTKKELSINSLIKSPETVKEEPMISINALHINTAFFSEILLRYQLRGIRRTIEKTFSPKPVALTKNSETS